MRVSRGAVPDGDMISWSTASMGGYELVYEASDHILWRDLATSGSSRARPCASRPRWCRLLVDEYDQSMSTRITVSLPDELVVAATSAVAAGQAASVSAYVAMALREQVDRESVADVLAEWLAEAGPLSDEETAWVGAALDRARLGS